MRWPAPGLIPLILIPRSHESQQHHQLRRPRPAVSEGPRPLRLPRAAAVPGMYGRTPRACFGVGVEQRRSPHALLFGLGWRLKDRRVTCVDSIVRVHDDDDTQARETPIGWTTPAKREGQAEEGKEMERAKGTDLRALEAGASAAFMDFRYVCWGGMGWRSKPVFRWHTRTRCV